MTTEELSKLYEPKAVEEKWYKFWEDNKFFTPKENGKLKPFVIVIPPPNVTGMLHMGHALDNSIQDVLIRYNRMKGIPTLWIPGTDHAGIATQNVVEKDLAKQGKKKDDIGREKFVELVWDWKKKYGGTITMQLRRLGASCDWTRERFTMDEGLSRAVKKAFVTLYKEGLIYRGKRIINWCPRCHTALSDIEVEHTDEKGHLWHLKYPIEGTDKFVTVATTRPETMLGDTAVAVNPKDERYKHLVGKMLVLPLVGRRIPVIKDDFVEASFGSGAVKVTPAHDVNDHEMGLRHNLPQINIMHPNAKIFISHLPADEQKEIASLEGLDRYKAREKIVADLEAKGYLDHIEEYNNSVGHCYRCKTVIEPYLSDQWFVSMKELVRPAIQAVEEGNIRYIPDRWTKVYINWMENHRDWCISRQIWWGHRIPAWYCECGEIIVTEETPTKCPKCGGTKLKQETDVLDTWFSSSLWPFSTLGWPDDTKDLKYFYPTTTLVTGYDIITFWVSKMIVMGLKFMKKAPFSNIFIHGLIRDASGKKMSKSTGNVIDPLAIIDKVGADALRFALISLISGQGQDIKLAEEKITEARNFTTKIWNAARYVLTFMTGPSKEHSLADKWILSRYNSAINEVTSGLDSYNFGDAARSLYDFIWSEYCDWYLELSKIGSSKEVALSVLEGTMRMLHPFMPFITEEIWQKLENRHKGENNTIMLSEWPVADKHAINEKLNEEVAVIQEIVRSVRNIRATLYVPHSQEVSLIIETKQMINDEQMKYIKPLAKVSDIKVYEHIKEKLSGTAVATLPGITIYVPLKGIIDLDKEVIRIKEKLVKIDGDIEKLNKKLENKNVPEAVSVKWKEEIAANLSQKNILENQIKFLSA
jgi:valyl-tRNA synthetase